MYRQGRVALRKGGAFAYVVRQGGAPGSSCAPRAPLPNVVPGATVRAKYQVSAGVSAHCPLERSLFTVALDITLTGENGGARWCFVDLLRKSVSRRRSPQEFVWPTNSRTQCTIYSFLGGSHGSHSPPCGWPVFWSRPRSRPVCCWRAAGAAAADNGALANDGSNSGVVSNVGTGNVFGSVDGNYVSTQQTATGSGASNQANTLAVKDNSGTILAGQSNKNFNIVFAPVFN